MQHINFQDKKVLIRVDFNVPLDKDQKITDDTRIQAAIPTLKHIIDEGGAIILMSHLGRPQKDKHEDGRIKRMKYSLVHTTERLQELMGCPVHFIDDTKGVGVTHAVGALKQGEILVLENTRFYPEEKKGDATFAKALADLADIYINDAFGTAHRAHASTATVANYFDVNHKSFGLLIRKELDHVDKLLNDAKRPFVAILGGAKVSDKIQLIEKLFDRVDSIIIGGGMAYTFIKAQGGQVGNSLVEEDKIDLAKSLLEQASSKNVDIILPEDSACGQEFNANTKREFFASNAIPDDRMGLDIGPKAILKAQALLAEAKTIFWNGPMGVFEFPAFADGTLAAAKSIAASTKEGAFSLIGGGDSVAAINQTGLADQVSFISTGGGATLTLLEGGAMPGLSAIDENYLKN